MTSLRHPTGQRTPTNPTRRARSRTVSAALLVVGAMTVPVLHGGPVGANGCSAAGAYAGGDGSAGSPNQIATREQLLRVAATSADWGEHFIQTADIDLAGCTWTGIGNSTTSFTGSYDGGSKSISNLNITSTTDSRWGLFRRTNGANIRNLTLSNFVINSTFGDVGALIGDAKNTSVNNITVTDVDLRGLDYVGGLIGAVSATDASVAITDVSVSGSVRSTDSSGPGEGTGGGVVGWVGLMSTSSPTEFSMSRATSTASVTGHDRVGGLIGYISLNGSSDGIHTATVTIAGSSSSGAVNGTLRTGGLVGMIWANGPSTVTLTDTFATGSVTKANDSGSDYQDVGGLIAHAEIVDDSTLTITDSFASGDVTSPQGNVGGMIGRLEHRTPTASTASSATISRSFANGDVDGRNNTGGLIGVIDHAGYIQGGEPPAIASTTIGQSFATGEVAGRNSVGGLVGVFQNRSSSAGATDTLTITDAYASGAVTGLSTSIAGLIGGLGERATITNAYSSGLVTATSSSPNDVGGLTGLMSTTGSSAVQSFWDTVASGQATSAGGTGKTTAEMKSIGTFSGASWGISDGTTGSTVWGICDTASYPFLIWQTQITAGYPGAVSCNAPAPAPAPDTDAASNSATTTTPTTTAPTSTTPAPVQVGGALPDMAPGEVQVYEDGQAVTVDVFVENESELVVESTNFELRLEGDCATGGCTIETDADGREVLRLEDDGGANVQGEGFKPGTPVHVWLFSDPVYLGVLTVQADGTFAGDIDLGDVQIGEHTLQVNGTSERGGQRSANLGVVVDPQPATTPNPVTLPATGSTTTWWPIALLAAGLVITAATRRRSHT